MLLAEWYEWLHKLMTTAIPVKNLHRQSIPPWITSQNFSLYENIEIKQRAHSKKSGAAIAAKIAQLEKELAENCEQDRNNYEAALFQSRDSKRLFKYFKSLRKSGTPIPARVSFTGSHAQTPTEKVDLFKAFFESVYIESTKYKQLEGPEPEQLISELALSEKMVVRLTKKLDVAKSKGIVNIPNELLKETPALAKLKASGFRKCLQLGEFPSL